MVKRKDLNLCDNCGIPIYWQPTVVDGHTYCCPGCAAGGPCTCDYSRLPHVGEFRAIICRTSVIRLSAPRQQHRSLLANESDDFADSGTEQEAEKRP